MRDDVRLLREAIRLMLEEDPRMGQAALGDPDLKRGAGGSAGGSRIYKDYEPSMWEKLKSKLFGKKSAAMVGKEKEDAARAHVEGRRKNIELGLELLPQEDKSVENFPVNVWTRDSIVRVGYLFPNPVRSGRSSAGRLYGWSDDDMYRVVTLASIEIMKENESIKKFNDIVKDFETKTGVKVPIKTVVHDDDQLFRAGFQGIRNDVATFVDTVLEFWFAESKKPYHERMKGGPDWSGRYSTYVKQFGNEAEARWQNKIRSEREERKAAKRAEQEKRTAANLARKGQPRTQQQQQPQREEE